MCAIATSPRTGRRAQHTSSDPHALIAYAPRGAGLLCALVYAARGDDVYGWIGPVDGVCEPGYFQVMDYFSRKESAFYSTRGGDLYGGWVRDYDARTTVLDKPVAVDDELAHRLEHMQFVFAQEWLSFAGDEDAEAQAERYREAELAHQDVNLKFERLNKLEKDQPVWIYRSPGFDVRMVKRLARDWPLDYRGVEA